MKRRDNRPLDVPSPHALHSPHSLGQVRPRPADPIAARRGGPTAMRKLRMLLGYEIWRAMGYSRRDALRYSRLGRFTQHQRRLRA